jgi:hypothetical protein
MRKLRQLSPLFIHCSSVLLLIVSFWSGLYAQDRSITTYQYRHVPDDKINEFIKRETTYWAKVAEKATKDKTMSFWALLEKEGGHDLPNSSNFLFINTFPNIDKIGDVFNNPEAAAGVKISEMETNSFSTVTSTFFLHDVNWAQNAKATPEKDFNYVVLNYHDTRYADSLINLEKKYWQPFIQKSMDNGLTPQQAWGNAILLAPQGDDIKFTAVSYDLFKNLQDALMPNWDVKAVFPVKGLGMIDKLLLTRPGIAVYRIVKVVTAPN